LKVSFEAAALPMPGTPKAIPAAVVAKEAPRNFRLSIVIVCTPLIFLKVSVYTQSGFDIADSMPLLK
jgi:hypothetical protein